VAHIRTGERDQTTSKEMILPVEEPPGPRRRQ